jgi:hypothetical protein
MNVLKQLYMFPRSISSYFQGVNFCFFIFVCPKFQLPCVMNTSHWAKRFVIFSTNPHQIIHCRFARTPRVVCGTVLYPVHEPQPAHHQRSHAHVKEIKVLVKIGAVQPNPIVTGRMWRCRNGCAWVGQEEQVGAPTVPSSDIECPS